eukprot:9035996-Karenia_brevis.AAC.1
MPEETIDNMWDYAKAAPSRKKARNATTNEKQSKKVQNMLPGPKLLLAHGNRHECSPTFSSHYASHLNAHSSPFLGLLLRSWRSVDWFRCSFSACTMQDGRLPYGRLHDDSMVRTSYQL